MKPIPTLMAAALVATAGASVEIEVDVSKPTIDLPEHLYGLFFEDINWAADGGLYAELVQNRSFEYFPVAENDPLGKKMVPLFAWEKIGGNPVELSVEETDPLNWNNKHYAKLKSAATAKVGVVNAGFDGIPLDQGASYRVSVFVRTRGWSGNGAITATLLDADGSECGTASLGEATGEWSKLEEEIVSSKTTDQAKLAISTEGSGVIDLDMISLFPKDTYKGRVNGLRKDLVEALADLHPKFLRFPGGCIAHGCGLDNAYRWKDTVGPVEERRPNWNRWGYHQTYGLGFFEYFQLCEDLGMTPLPVVPIGVSCGFTDPYEVVDIENLGEWIDDALDLIEFANGPADSEWGHVRAEMGHPEPFQLEFVCLGNEEHDTPEMRERFPRFVEAMRDRYPDIKIIGTSGLDPEIPIYDLMTREKVHSSDEHYYKDPSWFIAHQDRFDDFDRSKPKIFVGEYASRDKKQINAVAEAAYLTGIERNADLVDMTCYAPLFGRLGHCQWNPDLIYFNHREVVKTPSYHVQRMFASNKGDVYLANTVEVVDPQPQPTVSGTIGLGTWGTAAEFDEIRVNGRRVDPAGWQTARGRFAETAGVFAQTDTEARPAMATGTESYAGEEVTITLKARKVSGAEGFIIAFGGNDGSSWWFNVGGWGNRQHGLQHGRGDGLSIVKQTGGRLEPGRWYEVKVELTPGRIVCSLDGKPVIDHPVPAPRVSVASALDRKAGEAIVKLVNPSEREVSATIRLKGAERVADRGTAILLAGDADAQNTLEEPDRMAPTTREISTGSKFRVPLPPTSVQFIRTKVR
ncbi:alpha-L-arabinofuranosidase C-terminal domain-containing protein [Haloferula sargassicola]|uniref:non-reducing end alpha-L-arabinofuranosidase n=1 Tax=Haloferula sargassicola TaxID=490096 RepID=A0ABP9UWP5_9BACT